MFKKISLSVLAAATAMVAVPAAADAHPSRYPHSHNRGYDGYYGDRYQRGDYYRGSRSAYYGRNRGYYGRNRYYRGRCRDSGTTGTIIGAIAGGLLGKEVAEGRYNRGDGTTGAIIGGAVGALAGRAIDRDC